MAIKTLNVDDLSEATIFNFIHSEADDELRLGPTLDFNGDGLKDFAIVAPEKNNSESGGNIFGSAYIVYGTADGLPDSLDLKNLDGTNGFEIKNDSIASYGINDFFSILTGDFNNDGKDDIYVKMNLIVPKTGETTQGYFIYGTDEDIEAEIKTSSINNEYSYSYHNETSESTVRFKFADLNNDGFNDFIIGNPEKNTQENSYDFASNTQKGQGEIAVIFGSEENFPSKFDLMGSLDEFDNFDILIIENTSILNGTINKIGFYFEGIGDINGDGIDDLQLRREGNDQINSVNYTSIFVIYGSEKLKGSTLDIADLDISKGFEIALEDTRVRNAYDIGDINNDGIDDLGVLAGDLSSDSKLTVIFGTSENRTGNIDLDALAAGEGFKITQTLNYAASAGDINADGIDDFLADYGTKAYVVFGSEDGFASEIDLDTLSEDQGFAIDTHSESNSLRETHKIRAVGDVSGDGLDDLALTGLDGESIRIFTDFGFERALPVGPPVEPPIDGLNLIGTDEDEAMLGSAGDDTVKSGTGDDSVTAFAGKDRIGGGTGADTLKAGSDDDTIYGGDGDDLLQGAKGDDALYGKKGDDTLKGGHDDDLMLGGAQDDLLLGMNGNDTLEGAGHDDTLDGGNGEDHLRGNKGADLLKGGLGDDTLLGGAQSDRLIGNGGDDRLEGGGHDDTLKGGNGDDVLTGGTGADMFVFADDGSTDRVTDFADGVDMLRIVGERFGDLTIRQAGDDARITFGDSVILLEDESAGSLTASDFIF